MAQIKVYTKTGVRLGSTSKAYDTTIHEELMREFTLDFSIANTDGIFKFIGPDTVYECQGEKFDITDIDDYEDTKETKVSAEHISYRLNDYNVPVNYSFVGTAQEIGQDILNVSGANTDFKMGICAETGTKSFSLNNDKEITARAAIIALKNIGVEVSFSNFKINLPEMVGSVKDKPLKLSRRRWQKGNGWTYEADIADTRDVGVGDEFQIISDDIAIDSKRRIISYDRDPDDPLRNAVTLGVFIRDEASAAVETYDIANTANSTANAAKDKADNSVQQGEKYSNVSITHKDGFMATNKAGTQRVMMNGDDCFVVQVLQNGSWVTVNSLEVFGLLIERFTSQDAKEKFYIKVGKNTDGLYGLDFYINGEKAFRMGTDSKGYFSLFAAELLKLKTNKGVIDVDGATLQIETDDIVVADGNTAYGAYNGTFDYTKRDGTIGSVKVIKGLIVSA